VHDGKVVATGRNGVDFHVILTHHFHPMLTHPSSSPAGSRCG
jgi:hypothetical protein